MNKRAILPIAAAIAVLCTAFAFTACGDADGGNEEPPVPQVKTYTVSYDGAGGAGAPEAETVEENTEITVADGIEKTGYTFGGWSYAENTYSPGDKYTVTADTTFTAIWDANTYTVKFDGNGGRGEMESLSLTYDVETTLPVCEYMLGAAEFKGWATTASGEVEYTDGQGVKNLSSTDGDEITLYAVWDIPEPIGFSQAEYFYDKAAGCDLELPLTLNGSDIYIVEINDVALGDGLWSYDDTKKTLVISEDYMILSEKGEYEIKLVTDSDSDNIASCKLTIENTVFTAFDTATTKTLDYGKDTAVAFDITGEVTVKSLYCSDIQVPEEMYSFAGGKLAVSAEWIVKFVDGAEFKVLLSNNDIYGFTIKNNTLFYTDYDVTTIHNETLSNTGHNPMYQYYDNVSIVDAPQESGMTGKVLKITPNTAEVTYNCNGYITLASDGMDSTWRKGGFKRGKYYAVGFDYYTVGTSVGEFVYKASEFYGDHKKPYCRELLLGAGNDNKLHRFYDVIPYSEIEGTGLMLWAKFIGGGGEVYVDNFRIIELDEILTVTARDYQYESGTDYEMTIVDAGLPYELYIGSEQLEFVKESDGTVTIAAATMDKFEIGYNTVRAVTELYDTEFTVRVVDDRRAELTETVGNFSYYGGENLKLKGNFDMTSVVSMLQKAKFDNGGLPDWSMWNSDTTKEYKQYVSVTSGLDGNGYIEIDKEFLKKFYGTTEFTLTFSNGNSQDITVNSDALLVSNFDETNIVGYCNYNYPQEGEYHLNYGEVINSGFRGGSAEVKERGSGNKAFYVYDSVNCAARNVFTVKFHDHAWTLYRVHADESKLIRITFDYISTVEGAYFTTLKPATENYEENFYKEAQQVPVDGYIEVRQPLICDGQLHTFDSGWFTYNGELRMSMIKVPSFAAGENKFLMVDDYALTQISPPSATYEKGQSGECTIDLGGGIAVSEITYNGENYATSADGKITLDKTKLETLPFGTHKFMINSDIGALPLNVTVKGEGNVEITKTEYDYTFDTADLTLEGTVEGTTVASAVKKGSFLAKDFNGIDYQYDRSPAELDISNFVIENNRLIVKKALLDSLYLTTDITVDFANGQSVTIKINSNVRFFSDFDGTNLIHPLDCGNWYMTQDSAQMSIVEENGGHAIKYDPTKAALGHSQTSWVANKILIISTGWAGDGFYLKTMSSGEAVMSADKDYIITFDYKIVNAEGKTCEYYFESGNGDTENGEEKLTGTPGVFHTYTTRIVGGNARSATLGIGCYTPKGVEGCYIIVDNFRVTEVDKE